jgi:hypothetical protein
MIFKTTIFKTTISLGLLLALCTIGCSQVDERTKAEAVKAGISEEKAAELSRLELDAQEVGEITKAKKAGMDDESILKMVEALRKQNLKFDIGTDIDLMRGQGMGATPITQMVEMGAIPRMSDDIRALKEAGVGDVAIVEIAKIRFTEKKTILSGGEYARLKMSGISDSGLLSFINKGGTAQQLQKVSLDLALGKSEQEALKAAGL